MIVGIVGQATSGKTTAAQELVRELKYVRHRFAGPLKTMLRQIGLTEAQVDGDQKEVPCDLLCGRTPRWAMQTLGTQWGREHIGQDFWLRVWEETLPRRHHVVIDDVRYDNEAARVQALGGVIVRLERPGLPPPMDHTSEAGVSLSLVDATVHNDGSVDLLYTRVCDTLYALVGLAEQRRP